MGGRSDYMVEIDMPLGKKMISLRVPQRNLYALALPCYGEPVVDNKIAIRNAIRKPTGSAPLSGIVSPGDTVAVAIDDATRPTPTQDILEVLVEELVTSGVGREQIVVIVATGMHHPLDADQLRALVGQDISAHLKVINHNPYDEAGLVYIGQSKHGTPVWVNRVFYEADVKILTGYIAPHEIFGFTGGRKSVIPGLAGEATIRANHHFRWQTYDLRCDSLVIDGNPCHEDALDIANNVGVDFAVNVILNANDEVTQVVAGNHHEAWSIGACHAERLVEVVIERPVDVIVSSPGGHPHDINLYQTIDTVLVSKKRPVFKRGSAIVFAADCSQGIGASDMHEVFAVSKTLDDVKRIAERKDGSPGVYAAHVFAHYVAKHQLNIMGYIPGIPHKVLEEMFITPVGSLNAAIDTCLMMYGSDARILVVPSSRKVAIRPGWL